MPRKLRLADSATPSPFGQEGEAAWYRWVPGLAPDSLRVVCRNGQVVVSGERRERRPHGVPGFLCMERPHGRFSRTILLEAPVDVPKAEARLAGGVLTITLPRLKDRRGRESVITVTREPAE